MKKYLMFLSALFAFATIVFSGCAGVYDSVSIAKTPIQLKNQIKIYSKKDSPLLFENQNKVSKKNIQDVEYKLAETFYAIANYGKSHGYKYFAIVQDNMNNLSGFPINSFSNIKELCSFELQNAKKNYKPRQICWSGHPDRGIIVNRYVSVPVKFFKDKIPGVFLYNIDEVLSQTKQYI